MCLLVSVKTNTISCSNVKMIKIYIPEGMRGSHYADSVGEGFEREESRRDFMMWDDEADNEIGDQGQQREHVEK